MTPLELNRVPLFPFESSTGNRLWPKGGSRISGLQVPKGAADSGNRACGSRGVQIRCSPLPRKPGTATFGNAEIWTNRPTLESQKRQCQSHGSSTSTVNTALGRALVLKEVMAFMRTI